MTCTIPTSAGLPFYRDLPDLEGFTDDIAGADAVIVGSYVPDGIAVGRLVQATARGTTAFYDIDTPVTVAALEAGRCAYLAADQVPRYDTYLSFTGGPMLSRLEGEFGAPQAVALYCCADPAVYRPSNGAKRWDLSYLGTYSDDRQPVLERLLLEPARRAPHLRFVVAGSQYPAELAWPANVERFEHVGPQDHAAFYGASRFTLNVTRADMVRAGYSPSVRLFEAGACATPVISDVWAGIETVFTPGESILLAADPDEVLGIIGDAAPDAGRRVGERARAAVLAHHTAAHRAAELEAALTAVWVRRYAS